MVQVHEPERCVRFRGYDRGHGCDRDRTDYAQHNRDFRDCEYHLPYLHTQQKDKQRTGKQLSL